MTTLVLEGLDGANPLGFFAALGVLRVADSAGGSERPRLGWRNDGVWRPVLSLPGTGDAAEDLVNVLETDLGAWREHAPELELRYRKGGAGAWACDLKPPPGEFRVYAASIAGEAAPERRRSADFASAFATETGIDGKGCTKPTALHFTAGQQQFLKTVRELLDGVTREHLREAIFGPWRYDSPLPHLRWDLTGERGYALVADSPGDQKPPGVPGADWLAFRALPFFPTAPVGCETHTTALRGHGNNFALLWPLWTAPATVPTVASLLGLPGLEALTGPERAARGIGAVLRSAVRRSAQGYGGFAPPERV